MPWLIDGDNVLGTWPGRRRSDGERRSLAFELQRWSREQRKRVVVVYDGDAPPDSRLGPDVHFSGTGRRADDVIVALLREQRNPRDWTVVTSDRALGDRCRHLHARLRRSDLFRPELLAGRVGEKPEEETDIDGWLRRFGEQPDAPDD